METPQALMPSHIILFLMLSQVVATATAAGSSYSNITKGTTLVAHGSPSSWSSPSGDFAFGFFPADSNSSLFLLAVWFNATTPKAVVWSANRNAPVPPGSTVQLTDDGRLSLKNKDGNEKWSAGASNASAAALLDSGNLVLLGDAASSSKFLWQSFDFPTDTLLPGQVLKQGSFIRSQLTTEDFSDGRFQLFAQTDGNLVLYPLALPTGNQYVAYWSTATSGSGNELVYNDSGSIYFAVSNGTIVNITTSHFSTHDFYQRAKLDPDGVFRQYVYPKDGTASSLSKAWNGVGKVPTDICRNLVVENVGSGVCGYNSYCSSDDQTEINCMCPPRYSFIDPAKKYKGCKQDFIQNCELYGPSEFELIPVDNVDWPYYDYEHYTEVDEDRCGQLCLEDCFCVVAVYSSEDRGCFKKRPPLTHGRTGSYVNRRALIKVSKSNASLTLPQGPTTTIPRKEKSTVAAVLLGFSGSLNLILIALVSFTIFASQRKRGRVFQRQSSIATLGLRAFSYKELEEATDEFKEELGRGACGIVYKGVVPSRGSTSVAVKKLDRLLQMDNEKEFSNEVRSIGQTHHKNLVKLIGYCNEGSHRLLVYEYMSKGSLTSFLFGDVKLPWEKRVQIIIGIGRGLLYLHEECSTPIIHCDIKPQNVLLDDTFVARISDFGLAKLMNQTRTNTGIRGTRGYVAPEWFKSSVITTKVDVYSFGVMLLEIICCRKNVERGIEEEDGVEEPVLEYWAYDCCKQGRLERLLKDDEEALADLRRAKRFIAVAIWCIQEDPSLRPSMQMVTQMLEGAVPVTEPPDPSSFSSQ